MPDYDAYLTGRAEADAMQADHNRAADVARIIDDNPTSITLTRSGTALDAQTVLATRARGTTTEQRGESGTAGEGELLLIGVRGHATRDDFDVRRGDYFVLAGAAWRVVFVEAYMPGQMVAHCEGQQ